MAAPAQITDRAKRYRAVQTVTGPKVCVLCGARPSGGRPLDVMHLSGNESHGERENLAYGCRSCNGKLAAAFKAVGAGVPTNQYNPAGGSHDFYVIHNGKVALRTNDYFEASQHATALKRSHPSDKVSIGERVSKNPASKEIPSFAQYMWAVSNHSRGSHDAGGAIIHATPKYKRIEYAKRIVTKAQRTKRERADERWNPAGAFEVILSRQGREMVFKTFKSRDAAERFAEKKNEPRSGLHGKTIYPEGVYSVREAGKRNPATESADVYEEFHGHASRELVEVKKRVHHHEHLAAAGVLERLVVLGVDKREHEIAGFGKLCILAFNEEKDQLFIEGGDQSINLEDFGITGPHEMETLGRVKVIDYFTDKSHLGDEGGRATYTHTFRTTNKGGKHVTVKIARYPTLIYDVVNEQLLLSGGSYSIRAEGIDV